MRIWEQSWKDSFLVGVAALQWLLFGVLFAIHRQGGRATLWLVAGLIVFLICTNFQCVAHNFLHLPFFSSPWMNTLFSVSNTLLIGVPQTLYKYHHLNHHRFNSDYRNADGITHDLSSIYRYSREPDRAESIVKYALLGPIRGDVIAVYRTAATHGESRLVHAEMLTLGAAVLTLIWASPTFAVFVYLPIWYLGQVAAYAENYVEHFGALPGNRKTDSVSCYSGWYNRLWFNNGYHQEHHWRPQVHWTRVCHLTTELPGEEHRRVVPYAHWFNVPLLVPSSRPKPR